MQLQNLKKPLILNLKTDIIEKQVKSINVEYINWREKWGDQFNPNVGSGKLKEYILIRKAS